MKVVQRSRILNQTGIALMLVSSLAAACSGSKDAAPKNHAPQATEEEPTTNRPDEGNASGLLGQPGGDMLVAYEVILGEKASVRIDRGGAYEYHDGDVVRTGLLDLKDVQWIQGSLASLEYQFSHPGYRLDAIECRNLPVAEGGHSIVALADEQPAPADQPVATPAAPADQPAAAPADEHDWGIRAIRVQSLMGLAPVIFTRNDSARCLLSGLSAEGFDQKLEEWMGKLVQKLAPVAVANECQSANLKLEELLRQTRACRVDTDCAWVDSSYHPVFPGELHFITTDDCSVIGSAVVGNAQFVAASTDKLLELRSAARDACGNQLTRSECSDTVGFQASDYAPACLAGSCVYGLLPGAPSVR